MSVQKIFSKIDLLLAGIRVQATCPKLNMSLACHSNGYLDLSLDWYNLTADRCDERKNISLKVASLIWLDLVVCWLAVHGLLHQSACIDATEHHIVAYCAWYLQLVAQPAGR